MATEIEYKFLVNREKWDQVEKSQPELIVQGFLMKSKELVIRVRIKGEKGFLTIKGANTGISRSEFEYEIPLQDAEELMQQFIGKYISKHRYEVIFAGKKWEVDVFSGKLEGLILAELEVDSADEKISLPDWVTEDVSTNPEYFNAVLIERC